MIPQYLVDFDLEQLPEQATDVIVIGTGIAGLFTALQVSKNHHVVLIAKDGLMESNTRYAQGGIAAVMAETDSPEYHKQDTLVAGAGLCSRDAVEVLVHEGPEVVRELIGLGAEFDQNHGELALTREGAHSHRRILHAHGDATGYEVVRALAEQVRKNDQIEVWEHHYVIDLITAEKECLGALVQKPDGDRLFLRGNATVLCSGGGGQIYGHTTNPDVATADGMAIAYRAGAVLRDLEFVQFHPTALCHPGAPQFLISEAVRGEGAILRNSAGERFMDKYHPQMELAPRDIVARAIANEMMNDSTNPFVYLDITHEDPDAVRRRFPTIYETCLKYGIDITSDWIPVAPAAHYMMGGVRTGLNGETNLARLYACGEVSSTGVHGANRLASNSLLEALVFGRRIGQQLSALTPVSEEKVKLSYHLNRTLEPEMSVADSKARLQETMVRYVGLRRKAEPLEEGIAKLQQQMSIFEAELKTTEQLEYANMVNSALLIAQSALLRKESRGGHYREDYPNAGSEVMHTLCQKEKGMLEELNS